jgi:hypothetical protein
MQRLWFSMVCFSLCAGFQQPALAGEAVEETKAKLQNIRKQLEDLRQQEQTLLKQLEKAKKEAAKREESYVKAEVKGTLRHEVLFAGLARWEGWTITAGEFKWELDFGKDKKFQALAKANDGKTVVVMGTVEIRPASLPAYQTSLGRTTVLKVATFKATAK